jgi:quinate dehydrogenase
MVNRLESEINEIQAWFSSKNDTLSECNRFGGNLRAVLSLEEAKLLPTPLYVVGAVPDFPPQTDGKKTAHAVVQGFLKR